MAAPWHSVRTEHRGLPFGIHCRRSLAPHLDADAEEILDITRQCYDRYHEKFEEPYPFDSYDQAFVPEFNAGAMENPGLVTFRDEFIYRSAVTDTERQTRGMVIAHEMAHMWFGDLVTLQWWDDIWLNESFAEYMGYQTLTEATRFTDTWTDFGVVRKAWGYDADQRPSTHPVAPENVDDTASALLNFDGISYAKGASALRQLVAWLGEKDFLAKHQHPLRPPQVRQRHPRRLHRLPRLRHGTRRPRVGGRVAADDGVDTLSPTVTRADDGTYTLTVDRAGSRPHRIAVGLYDQDPGDTGRLTLRERLDLDVPQSEPQPLGKRPALLLLNDGDLTYAKVRFDPDSFDAVRTSLSGLPDPLTRAVVWNALRDAVRDGELPASAYLDAARAHLPHETDLALVQGVLAFASAQVTDRYLTPRAARSPSPPSPRCAVTSSAAPRTAPTPACASSPYATSSMSQRTRTPSPRGSPRAPSPAAPSWTRSSAGASWPAWPSWAPPTSPRSPPSWSATRPPPARKAPPAAAPPCPTPRPSARPGRRCSPPTTSPTTSSPPPPRASGSPNRPIWYGSTCPASTRTRWPSPPAGAPPSPTRQAAGRSPPTPSTRKPSASARNASAMPTSSRPSAASWSTNWTTWDGRCGYGGDTDQPVRRLRTRPFRGRSGRCWGRSPSNARTDTGH